MSNLRRAFFLVLLVLPLLAFGCKNPFASKNDNANSSNDNVNVVLPQANANSANVNAQAAPAPSDAVGRIAMSFVERYGSYSNQSDFGNLENLYPFMTDAFATSTRATVAAERRKGTDNSVYYGLTTRATAFTVGSFDEQAGTATMTVTTARQESVGSSADVRRYDQDAIVTMTNVDGAWKVSGLTWRE